MVTLRNANLSQTRAEKCGSLILNVHDVQIVCYFIIGLYLFLLYNFPVQVAQMVAV